MSQRFNQAGLITFSSAIPDAYFETDNKEMVRSIVSNFLESCNFDLTTPSGPDAIVYIDITKPDTGVTIEVHPKYDDNPAVDRYREGAARHRWWITATLVALFKMVKEHKPLADAEKVVADIKKKIKNTSNNTGQPTKSSGPNPKDFDVDKHDITTVRGSAVSYRPGTELAIDLLKQSVHSYISQRIFDRGTVTPRGLRTLPLSDSEYTIRKHALIVRETKNKTEAQSATPQVDIVLKEEKAKPKPVKNTGGKKTKKKKKSSKVKKNKK